MGRGETTVVYRARELRSDRIVALRILVTASKDRAGAERRRFLQNAEQLARLDHPNIAKILAIEERTDMVFVVQEFLNAGSLTRRRQRMSLAPQQVAALIAPIAAAVHCIHQHGLVHGQLGPHEILLTQPPTDAPASATPEAQALGSASPADRLLLGIVPKLADLGFGCPPEDTSVHGQPAQARKWPEYLAPEQTREHATSVGPAADIHALGVILYELLVGRPPFLGATVPETLTLIQTLAPVPPRALRPGVPVELELICLKCLEKVPACRYGTAAEFADDLQTFLLDGQWRPGLVQRLRRWLARGYRRARSMHVVLGFLLVAGLVALMITAWSALHERQRRQVVTGLEAERAAGHARQVQSQRQLLELATRIGVEEPDVARALLWFAEAFRLAEVLGDAECCEAALIRFRNWDLAAQQVRSHGKENALGALASPRPPEPPAKLVGVHVSAADGRARNFVARADGHFVATASLRSSAEVPSATRVYDARTGKSAGPELPVDGEVVCLGIHPEQPLLALAIATSGKQDRKDKGPVHTHALRFVNWQTGGREDNAHDLSFKPVALTFAPNGKRLAVLGAEGQVMVCSALTGEQAATTTVATPRARPGAAATGTPGVSFSPDSRLILVWGLDTFVHIVDAAAPALLPPRLVDATTCSGISLSADQRWLATRHENANVTIWDMVTGGRAAVSAPLEGTAQAVATMFYPDGDRLLTAGRDGTVRTWQWRAGRLAAPPVHIGRELLAAYVHANPQWIVTASRDGAVRVWEQQTGLPLSPAFAGPAGPWTSISVDTERRFITGSHGDGSISRYSVDEILRPMQRPDAVPYSADDLKIQAQARSGFAIGENLVFRLLAADERQEFLLECRHRGLALGNAQQPSK